MDARPGLLSGLLGCPGKGCKYTQPWYETLEIPSPIHRECLDIASFISHRLSWVELASIDE